MTKVNRHQRKELMGKTGEAVNIASQVRRCKQACRYRVELVALQIGGEALVGQWSSVEARCRRQQKGSGEGGSDILSLSINCDAGQGIQVLAASPIVLLVCIGWWILSSN